MKAWRLNNMKVAAKMDSNLKAMAQIKQWTKDTESEKDYGPYKLEMTRLHTEIKAAQSNHIPHRLSNQQVVLPEQPHLYITALMNQSTVQDCIALAQSYERNRDSASKRGNAASAL